MALELYPGTRGVARSIEEIAGLGATHVALVVTWSQRDVRATKIAPGSATVADERVVAAIAAAHRAGLEILLFPILTLDRTGPGKWRGTVAPRDRGAWWDSYERFILHYAELAAAGKVEALLVGSELGSTEGWRDRWYHLISRVEKVYSGAVVYSANWDHFDQVSFWRRLDAFGVNGYFELTRDHDAPAAELTRAWRRARHDLLALAAARKLPLWITEVGYTSTDGAATTPWDYTTRAGLDLEEQRRCYAAFRAAWDGVAGLDAVFFWSWQGAGGPRDRGYTPRGKPAEQLVRAWFQARERKPKR